MKIILVATNAHGKSHVFVSDSLKSLSLQEAFLYVDSGTLENLFLVRGIYGKYIRSAPNALEKDNLDNISVSAADIIRYANQTKHAQSTDAISNYTARYFASLAEEGGPFLKPVGDHKALIVDVKSTFIPHATIIAQAAKEFNIDKYLLGAILIDEIARMDPFEDILEFLGLKIIGRNVSVGVAQVKLETANSMIKKNLYRPNTDDKRLPFTGTLSNKDREHLYQYVIEPKHNIRFAAAYIRDLINVWEKKIDLSKRPEIVATLYAMGYGMPKVDPKANKRGEQITTEFYALAKKWLK